MSAKRDNAERSEKVKVLLVDDHPIVRQGLRELLEQQPDLTVCAEARDAAGALEAAGRCKPDLAIVDISLKDSSGIDLIKDFRLRFPGLLVLVLSMHDESLYAERVLRAGACGYVTKEEAPEQLLEALRRVLEGDLYVSQKVASRMIHKLVEGRPDEGGLPVDRLSDRQLQIYGMIGRGIGTRQIAQKLHLSVKTVESHRENIKIKLGLADGSELLRHAIEWVRSQGA